MEIGNAVMGLLSTYQLTAIFLGSFFFGETFVIAASFLAAQGALSLPAIFCISLLGTIISDVLWFMLGERIIRFFHKQDLVREKSEKLFSFIDRVTHGRLFLSLIFIKFLYGTRILTIVYLSHRKTNFWKFLIFDIIGSALWLMVVISIGWLAGKSIVNLVPVWNTFEYGILLLVLIIIVFKWYSAWISKKATTE